MAENQISPLPLGEGPGVRAAGTWKRPNPYAQVALTYVRHVGASGIWGYVTAAVMLIAFVFLGTLIAGTDHNHNGLLLLIVIVFSLSLWRMIVAHAREQFADSRAHLMPNFRRAHIIVVAVLALIVGVVLPVTLTWLAGLHSVVPVALTVFFMGTVLPQPRWLKVLLSTFAYALFALFLILQQSKRTSALEQFASGHWSSGQWELPAFILLVAGAVLTLRGGMRLARMNEDMPDYHQPIKGDGTTTRKSVDQGEAGEGKFPVGFRNWLAERHVAGLAGHARRADTSRWSRVCRWQAGMATGWSIWLYGFAPILFIYALHALPWVFGNGRTSPGLPPWLFGLCLTFCPVVVSAGGWNERTRALARELLMPVGRSDYLRQLGAAAGLTQLQLWGTMSVAAILCMLTIAEPTSQFVAIANLLVISGLSQIWLFGMIVWWTRCRSMILGILAIILAVAEPLFLNIVLAPIEAGGGLAEWQYATWSVAGLFALFGVLLLRNAYRRWWLTELDCVEV